MKDFRFAYPSEREAADRVLDDLLQFLSDCSVEEDVARALSHAVSEAFTNAVIHGNCESASKLVEVHLRVMDSQVIADIIDQGKGGVKRIESRKPPTELDEGGRGINLIRHYASSSSFTETGNGGLKVSIVIYRARKTTA